MDAYLAGDDHALGNLFRLLAPRIRRVVQSRIDDPDLVDDIVQLTFVKAHRGRHAFRARHGAGEGGHGDDAVIAWYLAIARNTAVDGVRSERRHQHRRVRPIDAHEPEAYEEVAAIGDDPESASIESQDRDAIRQRVRSAIEALPKGQRDVVTLHKIDGLSMQEVAERLQVRSGAARVRAHRVYLALGQALGHHDSPSAAA